MEPTPEADLSAQASSLMGRTECKSLPPTSRTPPEDQGAPENLQREFRDERESCGGTAWAEAAPTPDNEEPGDAGSGNQDTGNEGREDQGWK